jgi:small-conductance mechanosensitive channel
VDSVREQAQTALGYQFELGQFAFSVGGLLAAFATLVMVWLLTRTIERGFTRHAAEREIRSRAAIYTVSRIVRYALFAIGAMLALSFLGIPMSRFAVLAGAIGVGLGFGLQAIFSNFISGIILLFERSLRVGDFVELESGLHGEVRAINIRATLISTNDDVDILVPNSEFVTGRVVNWTHGDATRRMRIPFTVAYGSNKEVVKKAALEAAAEVPFTQAQQGPRSPQVWLVGFGKSALDFELVVWLTAQATKRPSAVEAAYMWALESALCKYQLEIPFPQHDVRLRSLFGLEGEAAQALLRGREPRVDGGEETTAISERERSHLARNDAVAEVGRAAREEAARKAADEEAARLADGAAPGQLPSALAQPMSDPSAGGPDGNAGGGDPKAANRS